MVCPRMVMKLIDLDKLLQIWRLQGYAPALTKLFSSIWLRLNYSCRMRVPASSGVWPENSLLSGTLNDLFSRQKKLLGSREKIGVGSKCSNWSNVSESSKYGQAVEERQLCSEPFSCVCFLSWGQFSRHGKYRIYTVVSCQYYRPLYFVYFGFPM